MRKLILIILIIVIFILTVFGICLADKGSKSTTGFSDSNTLFKIENGTVTIFNEEIRLK